MGFGPFFFGTNKNMLNKRADKLELLRIAEAVALEKAIDKELIISSMETGIAKAAKSKFGQDNEIKVSINRENGDIEIFRKLIVSENPENSNTEIKLEDAINLNNINKDKTIGDLNAIKQRDGATAIGDGLVLGVDMANSIPNKKKVVILLSDGDHNAGVVTPNEAVQYAIQKKIQIHTIGMGSEEPVLLGTNIYGNPLYAELNEKELIAIATAANGKYYKSVDNNSLNEIFEQITDDIDRELEQVSIKDWFFIAAVVVLAANIYIVYGKYRIVI